MKNKIMLILVFSVLFFNCENKLNNEEIKLIQDAKPILDIKKATYLYHFAYDCIEQEYPNKLNQVIGDANYLKSPKELHPAFYGCFDWHSSVHGHWTLVTILKEISNFEFQDEILLKLKTTLTKENIEKEILYFDDVHNNTYERTYGWAWVLKLSEALKEWKHPEAKILEENLQPLVDLLISKYLEFLPKLTYPIRIGEHQNIAFGMSFALDYAEKYHPALAQLIKQRAKDYFLKDVSCPLTWEPGGFDFFSPCLQEAVLMMKVLPKEEFIKWFELFMPDFSKNPSLYLQIAEVSDRSDGKLAHLDGLNFSRAWCLYELGTYLDNYKMMDLANQHFHASYDKMDSGEYAGAHWLASFAMYAIQQAKGGQ
ncbi:MAG: DUF2891 domain-containing protein [Flavobacteriaceae bacterium]|nr:DUF2891 domain-containing protein [Flavobacteriaceae bacterium]